MRNSFSEYHPLVNLIYFVLVISFSLALPHPLAQGMSLVGAIAYSGFTDARRGALRLIRVSIPMALITAIINPLFNHEGSTVIFYLSDKSPVTAESLLYGLSAGAMIVTLISWFFLLSRVMTTDKLIYLFGKSIPSLSLVLSMSLRLVPKFGVQMKEIAQAQKGLGADFSGGSALQKTRAAIGIFSVMLTRALENSIETADSMKSRGYGLGGRTSFSIYKFTDRDKYTLVWLGFCGLFLLAGAMLSAFGFVYFPEIRYAAFNMTTIPFYLVLTALYLTPVLLSIKEEREWKRSASEM